MKNKFAVLCMLFFFLLPANFVVAGDAVNPQLVFMGAKATSLGGTNPALAQELQSVFINPASIGQIDHFEITATNKNIYGLIDGIIVNACYPLFGFNLGASFGYQMLSNIPETIYSDNRVRETGNYFSSGYNLYQLSIARTLTQIIPYTDLTVGVNGKYYTQILYTDSRSAFALDVGVIMKTDFFNNDIVKKVSLGASLLNLYNTPFTWAKQGGQSSLARTLLYGVGVKAFTNELTLYLNNDVDNRFMYGLEYLLPFNLSIRGSSNFSVFNVGAGLVINRLYFLNRYIGLKLDYNYTQYPYPMNGEATHSFSVSFFQ